MEGLRFRPTPLPIHFVWTGGPLPDWARSNIDRARELHPGRDVHLHGDEILCDGWGRLWDQARKPCNRGDLLKYSAARRIGGWVMDCDVWFLRPLSRLSPVTSKPTGCGHFKTDR